MKPIVTINQSTDTPARLERTPGALLTYLYDRSRDSQQGETPGQDFIAFAYDESRIAFAVCDGVSQSFFGDLAARFLGERLVSWLAQQPPDLTSSPLEAQADAFAGRVDRALRGWVDEAQRLVDTKPIGAYLPPMVRDALERKRDIGSETMFIAGLVDRGRNRLSVCWMGDMRLWLWDRQGTRRDLPGGVWQTRERWSTRVGPKNGTPRAAIMPLDTVARITIHTDGLGSRTDALADMSPANLDALAVRLADAPASDDVSILDINLDNTVAGVTALEAPALNTPEQDGAGRDLTWNTIDGAAWYRLAITAGGREWTVDVEEPRYSIPAEYGGKAIVRVQALASDRLPSAWSGPAVLDLPEGTPLAEAANAPSSRIRSTGAERDRTPASDESDGKQAAPGDKRLPTLVSPIPETVLGAEPERIAFHTAPVMTLAILLALAISVVWYLTNLRV